MERKIKILLVLIVANCWVCQAFSQVAGISGLKGKYRLDTNVILGNQNLPPLIDGLIKDTLAEKKSIKEIPSFVIKFLKKLSGSFTIASPGEDWQEGDVIVNAKLPDRQLIYFGLGNNIALMAYYTGGIGVSEHILIIKFTGTTITDFWCGDFLRDVKNKKEILNFLQEYKDNPSGIISSNRIFL